MQINEKILISKNTPYLNGGAMRFYMKKIPINMENTEFFRKVPKPKQKAEI